MKLKKKPQVRINFRLGEERFRLLIKKANKYHRGNLSEAMRKAIDLYLIEK